MTPSGFGSLGLKTAGDRFVMFRPKKPREDLRAARVIIRELLSRQSDFMKGSYGNQFGSFCPCGHLQNILDKVCAKCSIRLIKVFLFLLWFGLLKFKQSAEPPPEDVSLQEVEPPHVYTDPLQLQVLKCFFELLLLPLEPFGFLTSSLSPFA